MHEVKLAARVLWIGGSPCAGKSTITDILASRYGLRPYHCDEALDAHRLRVTADSQPTMDRIRHSSWNALWTRSIDVMLADEFGFFQEAFPLVIADLSGIPATETVVVEGSGLLPDLVSPYLSSLQSAIWLVPTPAFQRRQYARRPWVNDILQQCDDPRQAFDNWMTRDCCFADIIEESASRLNLRSERVDGSRSLEEIAALVAEWYCLK